jgi:hypothetical protein
MAVMVALPVIDPGLLIRAIDGQLLRRGGAAEQGDTSNGGHGGASCY